MDLWMVIVSTISSLANTYIDVKEDELKGHSSRVSGRGAFWFVVPRLVWYWIIVMGLCMFARWTWEVLL